MSKYRHIPVLLLLASGAIVIAAAPTPETLKQTASVAQLEAAIARNLEALETLLGAEKNFADNLTRDKISAKAASIAGLAQAILDHPDTKSTKIAAAYVRESSKRLTESESFENAKLQLGDVKLALTGKTLGYDADAKHNWYELMSMENMMEEMNQMQNDLRRTARRSRDPEADSLDALSAEVLALACKENLDYAGDEKDATLWKELSEQLASEYRSLGAAMRKKDTDAAREHHANAAKVCTACHDKFRD